MLGKLRLRLTVLYTLVAFAFLIVICAVTYGLVAYYFRSITDLALRHKMAHEYEVMGLSLPDELAIADIYWPQIRKNVWPVPLVSFDTIDEDTLRQAKAAYEQEHLAAGLVAGDDHWLEEAYDGELAAAFTISLDAQGQVTPARAPPLILTIYSRLPDQEAVQAALQSGSDLRTVPMENGDRVRLLTYRLPSNSAETMLQVGRILTDQDQILRRLLTGLVGVGCVAVALSAGGGWWLAGRSLRPVQESLERQRIFIANASHELRTPLTLIRASAEVAHGHLLSDQENRELLEDVIQEADHMTRLVDDLLLLSRLDAGRFLLEHRQVSLAELLADVQKQSAHLAKGRSLHIEVKNASGATLADPTRLRQVLLILLENALHYTPDGGTITLEAGETEDTAWITVADTGHGIPPEHLPHVFDRFYQVDSARNGEGAGLGLAIAKSLVEAQQGRISIESAPGSGTTVKVSLPRSEQLT